MNKLKSASTLLLVIIVASCAQKKKPTHSQKFKPALSQIVTSDSTKTKHAITPIIKPDPKQKPVSPSQKETTGSNIKDSMALNTNSKKTTDTRIKTLKVKKPKVKAEKEQPNKAFTISGTVDFTSDVGALDSVVKENTVLYFIPDKTVKSHAKEQTYTIKTQNKRFSPSVLVIPVGSTITFPNQDRILHNVFSVSKIAPFDLGLYAAGNQKQVQFNKTGIAYVNCNVHHAMHADILVIDTPYFVHLNKNNHFELNNLPTDKGQLFIWHPRAQLKEITSHHSNNLSIELNINRAKIPQHLNKFGSPYIKRRK